MTSRTSFIPFLFVLAAVLCPSSHLVAEEPLGRIVPGADEGQAVSGDTLPTVPADTVAWKLHETGRATYYSARMHGRMMASGERYHRDGLFCAHKKLPFGTLVRVVNKKNGKEVVVAVKDRGPFGKGLIIDLSNRAAKELDMLRDGVVPVELYIVK